jgi:hypothetical protein
METIMTKDSDPLPWCVKHHDGWCLTKNGKRPRSDHNVTTKCEHFVIAALSFEQTEPTCSECLATFGSTEPEPFYRAIDKALAEARAQGAAEERKRLISDAETQGRAKPLGQAEVIATHAAQWLRSNTREG